jgi:hypothetical protein
MLLHVALVAAVSATATSVGPMSLAEMVRFSDVIVVATVESVSEEAVKGGVEVKHWRPGGPARLGTARVERWFKGKPTDGRLVFLNQSTWTCDITGADVGERALFFFRELKEDTVQAGIVRYFQKFGERPLLRVVHAGRGQMGLRVVGGEELATCWTGDVILPDGAPRRAGPEPEYSFIESIPLDWLSREIPAIATAQHTPQLRVEASQGLLPGRRWELTVRLDRTARLVVGHPNDAVSSELVIDPGTARTIDKALEKAGGFRTIHELGAPRYGIWDRLIVVTTPEGDHSVRLGDLNEAEDPIQAKAAAELWTALRNAIDVAETIDHRPADAKLVVE